MPIIRPARPEDSGPLTELAVRSEAHWGYEEDFMNTFRELYGITEPFLAHHATFVLEEDRVPAGFYSLAEENGETELEHLFIEPSRLGQGLGKQLWEHMVDHCRQKGIQEISLVCGPQPKAFYLRMGAVETGEVESLVTPGRMVSKLSYRIP